MFKTYSDPRLTDAVVTAFGHEPTPADLQDLSDTVVVEMEEINGLVIEDFRLVDGRIEVNVEDSTFTDDEMLDRIVECIQSFSDHTLPILRAERGE